MKTLDVVIPTRNRLQKLLSCLESIPKLEFVRIKLIIDADPHCAEYLEDHFGKDSRYTLTYTPAHLGSVACRNMVIPDSKDGVLYATDDIVFTENCIETAYAQFNAKFKDDDGVVGITQLEKDFHPSGVALVGRKFIDRYPGRKLFCPQYYHFSAQEVMWNAEKVGKFYLSREAAIKHWHPAFYKAMMDQTHIDARVHRKKDLALRDYRKQSGLIWGYGNESADSRYW